MLFCLNVVVLFRLFLYLVGVYFAMRFLCCLFGCLFECLFALGLRIEVGFGGLGLLVACALHLIWTLVVRLVCFGLFAYSGLFGFGCVFI